MAKKTEKKKTVKPPRKPAFKVGKAMKKKK